MEHESKPAQIVDLICEGNSGVIEVKCHIVELLLLVSGAGHAFIWLCDGSS